MAISVTEMKKRMSSSSKRKSLRFRRLNKRMKGKAGRRRTRHGTIHLSAGGLAKLRRIGRLAGRKSGRASVQRKGTKTRRKFKALYNSVDQTLGHSRMLIESLIEFQIRTGRTDIAVELLEGSDPQLSSTPIGLFAQDVADKLVESSVASQFVDAVVIDENTIGVTFENTDNVTSSVLERELKQFGAVTVIARPGDKMDENVVSDLHVLAVSITDESLKELTEATENDDDSVDESNIDDLIESECAEIVKEYEGAIGNTVSDPAVKV